MSELARAIYHVLRLLVPARAAEISYANLIAALPPQWQGLAPNGPKLADALREIVVACRARGLPALTAIVVHAQDRVPGVGYYTIAHPAEANDAAARMIAWAHEIGRVRATTYPPDLESAE